MSPCVHKTAQANRRHIVECNNGTCIRESGGIDKSWRYHLAALTTMQVDYLY